MTELFKVLGLYCRIWIVCLCLIIRLMAVFFCLLTFRAIRFMKRYVESIRMITSVYVCVCARVCVCKKAVSMHLSVVFAHYRHHTLCRNLNSTFCCKRTETAAFSTRFQEWINLFASVSYRIHHPAMLLYLRVLSGSVFNVAACVTPFFI